MRITIRRGTKSLCYILNTYFNLIKSKKKIELYVIDEISLPISKKYKQISFNYIKQKNILFDSAIIASPSGLHFKHALFFLQRGGMEDRLPLLLIKMN